MKSFSSYSSLLNNGKQEKGGIGFGGSSERKSFNLVLPEGRVHGGGLMSLFGGSLKDPIDGN